MSEFEEIKEITFDGVDKPHDRVIKWSFGLRRVAAGLFENYSPEPVALEVDWQGLVPYPGSFVDPELVESHTDLLFKGHGKK